MAALPPAGIARRRLVIGTAVIGALAALSLLVVVLRVDRGDAERPAHRGDPLADLLAWIPADDSTASDFVAWTPDPGEPAQTNALDASTTYGQLGLDPVPAAVGLDANVSVQLGWGAAQITGWAAGAGGELVVLTGTFPVAGITSHFQAAGYARATYRGQTLLVWPGAATPGAVAAFPGIGAVVVWADRILVADSRERLERAVDVGLAGKGSLADQPVITAALASLAPISILTGVAQATLAAACDPNTVSASTTAAGRDNMTLVAYGRLGAGGERRTLVAVSYPSETVATANLATFAGGWQGGFVNARGAGASISTYGTVSDVSQTGRLLVAELVQGRDGGWVRSGIRFALPVCIAAMTLAPAATPDLTGGAGVIPTIERLSDGLPSAPGSGERFRAVSLQALATARDVTAPKSDADAGKVDTWLAAMRPLPAMAVLPDDANQLVAWTKVFGLPLSSLAGVAEFESAVGVATVGLVIGDWDIAALTNHLTAIGYQTIVIDGVRHFAIDPSPADAYPFLSTHLIWSNIAILGDRMWVSADQRTLRAQLAVATDPTSVRVRSARTLRPFEPADLAVQSEGAEALANRCGTVMPGVVGFALAMSANPGNTEARLALLLDGSTGGTTVTADLDRRLTLLTIPVPGATGEPENGSPIPTSAASLVSTLTYLGAIDQSAGVPAVAVARFAISPAQLPAARYVFTALLENCRLTGSG